MANGDANFTVIGMGGSVYNREYQVKLDEKVSQVMGNDDKISAKDLKENSIFSKLYETLDDTGKMNFDKVLSLDGDAETVNKNELKTLLTLLDADLTNVNGRDIYVVDNEIGTNKETSGIYAPDDAINIVYENTQTRAEQEADEIQKQEELEQKIEQLFDKVKDYDYKNGSDVAKVLNILGDNPEIGSSEGLEVHDSVLAAFFNGLFVYSEPCRGSCRYYLEDGTEIYHDLSISSQFLGEGGAVTITHPDGTVEKYNKKGEKIE